MRKSNQQTIGQLLEKFVTDNNLRNGLSQVELMQVWPEIVGHFISRHTTELRIGKNTLYISLDSPACREELAYRKSLIISKINALPQKIFIQDIVIH